MFVNDWNNMYKEQIQAQHSDMVKKLVKNPEDILQTLTPIKADLMHAIFGISGEAGEMLDNVKKRVIYNKPMDEEFYNNALEELGDMEFYLEQYRQALGINREETLVHNMDKLKKRYPNYNYSDSKAQERADKIIGYCIGDMHDRMCFGPTELISCQTETPVDGNYIWELTDVSKKAIYKAEQNIWKKLN